MRPSLSHVVGNSRLPVGAVRGFPGLPRCDWCSSWKNATWAGVSQLTSGGWDVAGGTILTRSLRLFGDANRGNEAFSFI